MTKQSAAEKEMRMRFKKAARRFGGRLSADEIGMLTIERIVAFRVMVGDFEGAEDCARTLLSMVCNFPDAARKLDDMVPTTKEGK